MKPAAVSVLIPCFNAAAWVEEAITSVLAQTETDLEVVVVDDGSTDETRELLYGMMQDAKVRFCVARLDGRLGVTRALNRGLVYCRAPYIARLDADDVMARDRLRIQREYLDTHPEVGVVGTWSVCRWPDGRLTMDEPPLEAEAIRAELRRRNPIAHPTVMLRREWLSRVGGYDESFPVGQDYALWARLSRMTDIVNLPRPLTIRRMHDGQVSRRRRWARRWAQVRVRAGLLFARELVA